MCAGKETAHNLRIKVNLSIGSTALILVDSDNTSELLRAGLDNLTSIINMYPETLEVLAAVQVSRHLAWTHRCALKDQPEHLPMPAAVAAKFAVGP